MIANSRLTRPSAPARKYAYCSDTMYLPKIAGQIKGVDLLFHESTFAQTEQARAKETYHTTAAQAANGFGRRGETIGYRTFLSSL